MSNAFHNKFHRKNHSSFKNLSIADSGWDPIASVESPYQGDFVLSASDNPLINGLALSSNQASVFAKLNDADVVGLNLNASNVEMMGGNVLGENGIAIGEYASSNSNSFVFAPVSNSTNPTSSCISNSVCIMDADGFYLRGSSDVNITSGDVLNPRGVVFKTSDSFTSEESDVRLRIETDNVSGNFISVKENDGAGNWVGTTEIFNDGIHTSYLSSTSLTVGTTLTLPNSSISSNMITGSSITLDKLAFSLTNETSGKANKDFSNVSTSALSTISNGVSGKLTGPDYIVETFISADRLSWYRKYASGYIEQGVRFLLSSSPQTITLPVSFNKENLAVTANLIYQNSSSADTGSYPKGLHVDSWTLNNVTVRCASTRTTSMSASFITYGY